MVGRTTMPTITIDTTVIISINNVIDKISFRIDIILYTPLLHYFINSSNSINVLLIIANDIIVNIVVHIVPIDKIINNFLIFLFLPFLYSSK